MSFRRARPAYWRLPHWACRAPLFAQVKKPEDGTEYLTLDKRGAVDAPQGKVEVIEFFWYSCPHCNAFEPRLEAWIKKQPADVVVRRVPVAFRDDFVPQQRLFYTLEAMGKLDELHGKVFQAIHADREPINREDSILEWAGKQGLDTDKFKELYNSFSVSGKARRATQLQDAYQGAGRARDRHRRPLLHRRRPGGQHGACAAGHRLPDRAKRARHD